MVVLNIIISIISLLTTIVGLWYLGEKKKAGYVWFTVSLCCQAYLFYLVENYFLILQMGVLILFNIKNYLKWKKEETTNGI